MNRCVICYNDGDAEDAAIIEFMHAQITPRNLKEHDICKAYVYLTFELSDDDMILWLMKYNDDPRNHYDSIVSSLKSYTDIRGVKDIVLCDYIISVREDVQFQREHYDR